MKEKKLTEECVALFKAHFSYTQDPDIGQQEEFYPYPLTEVSLVGDDILEFSFKTDPETQKQTYIQLKFMKDEKTGFKFFKLLHFNLQIPAKINQISQSLTLEYHDAFIRNNIIGNFIKIDYLFNKLWDGARGFIWNPTLVALAEKAIAEAQ